MQPRLDAKPSHPAAEVPRRAGPGRLLRGGIVVAGLAFAVWLLAPQVGEVPDGVTALGASRPGWLALALACATAAYVASAVALQGAVPVRLHFGRAVQVQVASSFASVVAPAGLAGMALNVRFLERSGLDRGQAVTSVGLGRLAGLSVHALTLAALAPFLVGHLHGAGLPSGRQALVAATLLTTLGFAAALRRPWRERAARALRPVGPLLGLVLRDPRRLAALVGGSMLTTMARALTLAAALRALEVSAPLLAVLALYLAAEAVGALGSTPGGLGLLDGALLTGLGGLGVPAASAVAAVLVFRLLTFWAPTAPGALNLKLLRRAGAL